MVEREQRVTDPKYMALRSRPGDLNRVIAGK